MMFPSNVYHSSVAEISKTALLSNVQFLQKQCPPQTKLLPMIKTNAYGHGMHIVSQMLAHIPIAGFGVANIAEAMELRNRGIRHPILSFGRINASIVEMAKHHQITVVLHHIEDIKLLAANPYPCDFHLELETGMNRLGLTEHDLDNQLKNLKALSSHFKGVFSHFSESENTDGTFTQNQMQNFKTITKKIQNIVPHKLIQHISNSGSILLHPEFGLDWVRPGIALYGFDPSGHINSSLQPVLSWKAPIIQIKKIQKGDAVGYGRAFIAPQSMTIATIPVGYGDGFLRLYKEVGVGYRQHRVKIIGNICMDMMMIDISHIQSPQLHDEVYILGPGYHGEATADEFSKVDQTISYEVLSRISSRVLRIES
ncbi:MAG: alanine racemase [Bdellovibrionales bacterium]|nr:alanine racemase [Bdellovibrionales bacterium]